jgi:hypothetical protein
MRLIGARLLGRGFLQRLPGLTKARLIAIVAAALLPYGSAIAQTTCFGKGSVLTCLDRNGGAAYQANCFGSKQYRSCTSQTGPQFTLSETPASANSSTTTGAIQPAGTAAAGSRPATDPAFGRPPSSASNPAAPIPAAAPRK